MTPLDNQPFILVGVLNGAQKFKGLAMADTGAGMTLISEAACKQHGVKIQPKEGNFVLADGTTTNKIVGICDLDLQVHDDVVLKLKEVRV